MQPESQAAYFPASEAWSRPARAAALREYQAFLDDVRRACGAAPPGAMPPDPAPTSAPCDAASPPTASPAKPPPPFADAESTSSHGSGALDVMQCAEVAPSVEAFGGAPWADVEEWLDRGGWAAPQARPSDPKLVSRTLDPSEPTQVIRAGIFQGLSASPRDVHIKVVEYSPGDIEVRVFKSPFVGADPELRLEGEGERREPPDEYERRESSLIRSRKTARQKCRALRVTHMMTLGKRGLFASYDECLAAFQRYLRLRERRFPNRPLSYVGVPEFDNGGWHLHVAIPGFLDVIPERVLWYRALGGRGNEQGEATPGSINMRSFLRRKGGRHHVPARVIAGYVCNYMGKDLESAVDFNRKAYWASRDIPEPIVRRYFARLMSIEAVIDDLPQLLGLRFGRPFEVPCAGFCEDFRLVVLNTG